MFGAFGAQAFVSDVADVRGALLADDLVSATMVTKVSKPGYHAGSELDQGEIGLEGRLRP